MVTASATVSEGIPATTGSPRTSKALEVASRGIRTPRDITNFALGHSIDVLQETVGAKQANASLRGVTVGLRAIEIGQRVGQHHEVADVKDGPQESSSNDPIAERRRQLQAELAELDEAEKLRN